MSQESNLFTHLNSEDIYCDNDNSGNNIRPYGPLVTQVSDSGSHGPLVFGAVWVF